jgi:SAM-dependent methyltransferase
MKTLKYFIDKLKIDVTQPSPIEIEGVGRLDLLRWLRELDFKTGVEIGVEQGLYSHLICDQNTQMKMYGVDPYLYHPEYREYESQEQMDGIFAQAQNRMKAAIANGQYTFIRKKSMDAVKDFEDNSLDFVYIDGNHEGEYPYEDIKEWAKKVRPGGIVAGHDYVRVKFLEFTIKDALEKYTKENNIHPWFVLGRYGKKRGVVRDRSRSWFFIK